MGVLYSLDLSSTTAILAGAVIILEECAYRMGRRAARRGIEPDDAVVGTLQNALLALLGLLLAFTFSMANTRFEMRKSLVVEEANAIGTTWLRAGFLPPALRDETRRELGSYLSYRTEQYDLLQKTGHAVHLDEFQEAAGRDHRHLWELAEQAPGQGANPEMLASYVEALNAMIDLHSSRVEAARNRVPETALFLLFALGIGSVWSVGHRAGLVGRRSFWSTTAFHTLVVLVIVVILDIDRPSRGMIRVSQGALVDLRDSLPVPPAP